MTCLCGHVKISHVGPAWNRCQLCACENYEEFEESVNKGLEISALQQRIEKLETAYKLASESCIRRGEKIDKLKAALQFYAGEGLDPKIYYTDQGVPYSAYQTRMLFDIGATAKQALAEGQP